MGNSSLATRNSVTVTEYSPLARRWLNPSAATQSALETHSVYRQAADFQPVLTGFLYQPANSFVGRHGGEEFMTLTIFQKNPGFDFPPLDPSPIRPILTLTQQKAPRSSEELIVAEQDGMRRRRTMFRWALERGDENVGIELRRGGGIGVARSDCGEVCRKEETLDDEKATCLCGYFSHRWVF